MSIWKTLRKPPYRTLVAVAFLALVVLIGYALWSPGDRVTDGRHDRGENAIWLQHGWLGHDEWFERNQRTDRIASFRDVNRIAELGELLRMQRFRDVYPHVAPTRRDGRLPPVDGQQVERFLDHVGPEIRVIPWVGGVLEDSAWPNESAWRQQFVDSIVQMLDQHPRLAGVHVNVEPWPTGDPDMLKLLEQIRAALPQESILSVAAYPPPTRWHPYPDIH